MKTRKYLNTKNLSNINRINCNEFTAECEGLLIVFKLVVKNFQVVLDIRANGIGFDEIDMSEEIIELFLSLGRIEHRIKSKEIDSLRKEARAKLLD